jgi:hypothetical protein
MPAHSSESLVIYDTQPDSLEVDTPVEQEEKHELPFFTRLREIWDKYKRTPQEVLVVEDEVDMEERFERLSGFIEQGLDYMRTGDYAMAIHHYSVAEGMEDLGIYVQADRDARYFGQDSFGTPELTAHCLDVIGKGSWALAPRHENDGNPPDSFHCIVPTVAYIVEHPSGSEYFSSVVTNGKSTAILLEIENEKRAAAGDPKRMEILNFGDARVYDLLPQEILHGIAEIHAEEYVHVLQYVKGAQEDLEKGFKDDLYGRSNNLAGGSDMGKEADVALYFLQQDVPVTSYFLDRWENNYNRRNQITEAGYELVETSEGFVLADVESS